jgi:hypothetical protein
MTPHKKLISLLNPDSTDFGKSVLKISLPLGIIVGTANTISI